MKEKIDIILEPRSRASFRSKPKRGPIRPSNTKRPLGRRRKAQSGIKFFDFGYKKTGDVWQTLQDYYLASFSWAGETPVTGSFDITASDDLLTNILLVPSDLWANRYRQVQNVDLAYSNFILYRLRDSDESYTQLSTSPVWADGNLGFTDAQITDQFELLFDGPLMEPFAIRPFDAIGSRLQKITSVLDPDGTEVVIPRSPAFQVFVMPRWTWFNGISSSMQGIDTVGPASAVYYTICYLNLFWGLIDRSVFIDSSNPNFGRVISGEGGWDFPLGYPNAYQASLYAQTLPEFRAFSVTYGELRTTSYGTSWLVGDFPAPPGVPSSPPPYPGNGHVAVFCAPDGPLNRLKAVIRTGSTNYYCWALP